MVLLEVPDRVNREILSFVGSIVTPARVSSFDAVEDGRTPSLVRRLLDRASTIGRRLMSVARARGGAGAASESRRR